MHRRAISIVCLAILLLPAGVQADRDSAVASAKALSAAFRTAAETATPAVVTIVASTAPNEERARAMRELLNDPRFRGLFPNPEDMPGLNSQVGSGVVIDRSGVILTNSHVVANADRVEVRFSDGSEVVAKEVSTDPSSDLAILKIEGNASLVPARLGDSDSLEIGDWVIAIGSPFELEATVSAGIISGKGRGISKIRRGRLLQTDAAINPGNSGGPLVNLDGEVIGINTAIATNSGGYQGIGFVIPINRGKWVARELLQHGRVRRAYLGIKIGELTARAARQLELSARSGVWVVGVVPDGPAAKAGLVDDDVIVEFAGPAVRSPGDLQDVVERKAIGSRQDLVVLRKGERMTQTVTMTALPDL